MSEKSRFAARLVVLAGAVLAGLLAAVVPAGPAFADTDLDIEELPRNMVAGGNPGNMEAVVRNDDEDEYSSAYFQIVVTMSGLQANQVHLSHGGTVLDGSPTRGAVRFLDRDQFRLDRNGEFTRTYSLSFAADVLGDVRSRRATIAIEVFGERDRNRFRNLARANRTVTVTIGPTLSAQPTLPPDTAEPGPAFTTFAPADAQQPASQSNDLGTIWPIYLFGLVLLVFGGVVVGWLILQRVRDREYEPALVAAAPGGPPPPMPPPPGPWQGGPMPGGPGPMPGGPMPGQGPVSDAPTMILPKVAPRHRAD